jgi:hypothetical protein
LMEYREQLLSKKDEKDEGSDDDDNLDIIEGEPNLEFADIPELKPLDSNSRSDERLYESFATPDSDGFSLDFILKVRSNDQIRRKFMSKLTY